jgi:hypothetical protein
MHDIGFLRCGWCGGIFVSGEALDCLQRSADDLVPRPPDDRRAIGHPGSALDLGELALMVAGAVLSVFD